MAPNPGVVGAIGTVLLALLAGCAGGSEDDGFSLSETSPSPEGTDAGPSPTVAPEPKGPPPGEAYRERIEFGMASSPTAPDMSVGLAWPSLNLTARLMTSAQCSILMSDPPSTGGNVFVRFTAPSGEASEMVFDPMTTCTLGTNNEIGRVETSARNEVGDWTVEISGRGLGVAVELTAFGF